MQHCGRGFRFACKPFAGILVVSELRTHYFDSNNSVERWNICFEHNAHSPSANDACDFISAKPSEMVRIFGGHQQIESVFDGNWLTLVGTAARR